MVPFLYTAREHHGVRTADELRRRHAAFLAEKAARGLRFAVHVDATSMTARVDANTWLFDCTCGAGVATDPEWGVGCCFGCGAVYTAIVFPSERQQIEAALIVRPKAFDRSWDPGESVTALRAQNRVLGVGDAATSVEAEPS